MSLPEQRGSANPQVVTILSGPTGCFWVGAHFWFVMATWEGGFEASLQYRRVTFESAYCLFTAHGLSMFVPKF
jgi:hypothetical protein